MSIFYLSRTHTHPLFNKNTKYYFGIAIAHTQQIRHGWPEPVITISFFFGKQCLFLSFPWSESAHATISGLWSIREEDVSGKEKPFCSNSILPWLRYWWQDGIPRLWQPHWHQEKEAKKTAEAHKVTGDCINGGIAYCQGYVHLFMFLRCWVDS